MNIRKNIEKIEKDIKKYSPYPEKVTLLPTTKYVDYKGVEEVFLAGCKIVGENRVQALMAKKEVLDENGYQDKIKWHFIGNLQKNKVKYIVPFIDMIHSVNKISLAKEIDKRAEKIKRKIRVTLEINILEEETKEGYTIERFYEELPELLKLKNIEIVGLMTMAPYTDNEELIRGCFSRLRELKEELNEKYFDDKLTELSMGMSNDYKIALSEGATLIRVGSKIF